MAPRTGFPSSHSLHSLAQDKLQIQGQSINPPPPLREAVVFMAPRTGFEPVTLRLTAECSTIELPGNVAVA
jgi:hypothetical protein